MSEERKSTVTKSISRKLNTAQYESLEVRVSAEEEIAWNNIEERVAKGRKITALVIADFQETLVKVQAELGLSNKPATVISSNKPSKQNNDAKPSGSAGFFDNLS